MGSQTGRFYFRKTLFNFLSICENVSHKSLKTSCQFNLVYDANTKSHIVPHVRKFVIMFIVQKKMNEHYSSAIQNLIQKLQLRYNTLKTAKSEFLTFSAYKNLYLGHNSSCKSYIQVLVQQISTCIMTSTYTRNSETCRNSKV